MKNFLFIIFLFWVVQIFSQENIKISKSDFEIVGKELGSAYKNLKNGDFFYKKHNINSYFKAIDFYKIAYEYNPNLAALNYKLGVCYVEIKEGMLGLEYLQKAYNLDSTVAEDLKLYLARAYHSANNFEEAKKFYKLALGSLTIGDSRKGEIEHYIEQCENGIKLKKQNNLILVSNLGIVNSEYKDYGSVITADGAKMYFTSRRPNMTGGIDPEDGQYYEDIYLSEKDGFNWTKPINVKSLNTAGHDDVVGLSHDGNTMILYYNGDLYYSNLKGDKWSKPKAFPRTINSSKIETSACFSLDGNTLYFVRGKDPDPSKSNGDIYYSKKLSNGKWGKAVKLPDNINTPYDEDGLFLFADGKTLYFSSKGHNSVGGFDIFKTTIINDSTYTDPVNLGFPINSGEDDIYFVMSPNNLTGYFTSVRKDTKGFTDIYEASFVGKFLYLNSEDNLIASIASPVSETNMEGEVVVVIKGKITSESGKPVDAEILIIDNNTNKVIYRTKANSKDGSYSVTIPVGKNYGMVINKQGYMFYSENFDLVTTKKYTEINNDVKIVSLAVNSSVTLRNIFFEFGSDKIQKTSIPELQRIVEFMKKHPDIKVEISGHTDNIGSYEKNMELSKQRAQTVANYLINNGIDPSRMRVVGYGYTKPIASNLTPEGREKNRRVEFKIIEK